MNNFNFMGGKRHEELGGLTLKEKSFLELYVFGEKPLKGDASKCYRATFDCSKMTEGSVWTLSCEMLKRPSVKEQLGRYLDSLTNEEEIKRKLHDETSTEHARDRIKAIELLGKTHAMFKDRLEADVKLSTFTLQEEEDLD